MLCEAKVEGSRTSSRRAVGSRRAVSRIAIEPGAVVLDRAGQYGQVEQVVANVVVYRLLEVESNEAPMCSADRHADLEVILAPGDIVTEAEFAALRAGAL
jgi:hypothetical protein